MRKYLVALLAVPVLFTVYVSAVLGRSRVIRAGTAVGLGAVLALGAISLARPASTTASPVSDIVPLTQAAFQVQVGTNTDLLAPATILFSTPMERESVESAVSVDPPAAVDLLWNDDQTSVSVVPTQHWAPGTYYTISVGPGALASTGRPMTRPARAAFLTRELASAAIAPTSKIEKRVAVDSSFTVSFDQSVDLRTVADSIRLDPPAVGALSRVTRPNGVTTYTFDPTRPLSPDTRYRLIVDGVRDAAGLEVAPVTMAVRTVPGPEVLRFRPRSGTDEVTRIAPISVRFSESMDRASAKKAFSVTVNRKKIAGTIQFAEDDTVLVFDPKATLPYDATVVATVAASARSKHGVALGTAAKGTFTTKPKSSPRTTQRSTTRTTTTPISRSSGGGSVGSGSWGAVERYYLRLMNCTRTGGLVTSGGACSSPGGRNVAALRLDAGISSRVARPYARKLAVNNMCTHFSGGNPGDRLRRAGYSSYRWAENLGCRSGNPYSAVLGSHRYFQSERSYNGGHWVNMMNAAYDRVGIGVWVSGGRVRLVVDFYHP